MTRTGLAALAALSVSPAALAQNSDVTIEGHVYEPRPAPADQLDLGSLSLPEGFSIDVFATGLGNARVIDVAENGDVYVTRREQGDVILLRDQDGDGRADGAPVTVASRPMMHGLYLDGDTAYLATVNDVYTAPVGGDGRFGALTRIIDDLPEGGQHPNRTLAIGPDDQLYITVGSTCNACGETNPENATILKARPDGSARSIYASGLRNTIGFDWHPRTGQLWGMDHGIDWLGDEEQVEELNRLTQGAKYGWPYVYGEDKINPADEPPGGITPQQWAQQSETPALGYTAHAAPMQMVFYTGGAFPAEFQGDAFVTMRGSWNRKPPSGYEVVRVAFGENGEPESFEPFLTGFLMEDGDGHAQAARLMGLAQTPDGALLIGDDENGVIYRVSYDGQGAGEAMPEQPDRAAGRTPPRETDLALPMLNADEAAGLTVQSSAIQNGGNIPPVYTETGEGVSPPLQWRAEGGEVRSWAILMEDPDASQPTPFVHWLAYNIPAARTSLPEGVPGAPSLPEPYNFLQGANDYGSTGYYGPNPPAGDGPHAYHIQIVGLDSMLDLKPGASREALLAAMEGHVVAAGELVGMFEK